MYKEKKNKTSDIKIAIPGPSIPRGVATFATHVLVNHETIVNNVQTDVWVFRASNMEQMKETKAMVIPTNTMLSMFGILFCLANGAMMDGKKKNTSNENTAAQIQGHLLFFIGAAHLTMNNVPPACWSS